MYSRIRFWLRRLHDDRRGAVIIYVTLGLTVFMGFSALAIDGSYLYLMSNRAQSAADAAALAAASQMPDEVAATTAANDFAGKNLEAGKWGDVLTDSDIAFGTWDTDARLFTADAEPADAVQVVVRMSDDNANPVQLFFANALGFAEAGVAAAAVATTGGAPGGVGEACLQALNPTEAEAFRVVGTAVINGEGCNIQVDSCHETSAFRANGSPTIDLTVVLDGGAIGSGDINICGGMDTTPGVDLPPDDHVNEGTGESLGDPFDAPPFDDLPAADETASCGESDFSANDDVTLSPGVYCGGISITGGGTVDLEPGTYYIKDGEFKITGNFEMIGEDVTFVLVGSDSNLDLGGVSSMALSAPTTGDYAGFVFFGDPENPASDTHKIHGTPLGAFHGIAYFPNAAVELVGTSATSGTGAPGEDDCSVLIADTLFFNGTVDLNLASECSAFEGTPAFGGGVGPLSIRLVD